MYIETSPDVLADLSGHGTPKRMKMLGKIGKVLTRTQIVAIDTDKFRETVATRNLVSNFDVYSCASVCLCCPCIVLERSKSRANFFMDQFRRNLGCNQKLRVTFGESARVTWMDVWHSCVACVRVVCACV